MTALLDIKSICWDNFDTIILGHLEELSNLTRKTELKDELLEQAIVHGKNVYSLYGDIS